MNQIVIVGNSPVSFFAAKLLDRELARQVHTQVVLITKDDRFFPSQAFRSLKDLGLKPVSKKESLKHIQVVIGEPKSINCNDHRVTTGNAQFDYSVLLLDQTPTFSSNDIQKISAQFLDIVTRLKAAQKLGKKLAVQLHFVGESVWSWQTALALKADAQPLLRDLQAHLSISSEVTTGGNLVEQFLNRNGILTKAPKATGLVGKVALPRKAVSPRAIKGVTLDAMQSIVTDGLLRSEQHKDVFVIDGRSRNFSNLVRSEQDIAKVVAHNIISTIANQQLTPIPTPVIASILQGSQSNFLWLGTLQTSGTKATAAVTFDRVLRRHFLS